MKRRVMLFVAAIFFLCMFDHPPILRAEQQRTITITVAHLNYILRQLPLAFPLATDPVHDRFIDIFSGQFRVQITVIKPNGAWAWHYIWIRPQVDNGKITCTITQIMVGGTLFNQRQLQQPNPYISDLNADAYCHALLSPFLVGYGPGVVVKNITLQPRMAHLDLGGALLPDAPNPVVVGGCTVYAMWPAQLNFRRGPGTDYDVISLMPGWWLDKPAPVLGWQGDWLKIDYRGTVGWVWKYYAIGSEECLPDYRNSSEAWLRSDTSQ
ncbi:MAG: SH3 domain-containing protein [Anaerolineae bacterium]|nr:SH3 domain-containing protein [Anaerolineae bacterium]